MREVVTGFSLLVVLLGAVAATLHAKSVVAGVWQGAIVYHPAQIEADLTVEMGGDPPVGTIHSPLMGLEFRPLQNLHVEGRAISFEVDPPGAGAPPDRMLGFQGEMAGDGQTITGTFSGHLAGQDLTLPFRLERKGEAGTEWAPAAKRPVTVLSEDLDELRVAFNRDQERVRLVLLLSPTCMACLGAAGVVQRYVLDTISGDCLQTYAVWGPMLGGEQQEHAEAATVQMPDPRVGHFWTDGHAVATRFRKAAGLPETVTGWDTFLLFPPGTIWDEAAPTPVSYMHINQPLPEDRALDAEELAEQIQSLVEGRAGC